MKFFAWLSWIQKLDFLFKLPLKLTLKNDFPTESGMVYTDLGMVPKGSGMLNMWSGMVGLGS